MSRYRLDTVAKFAMASLDKQRPYHLFKVTSGEADCCINLPKLIQLINKIIYFFIYIYMRKHCNVPWHIISKDVSLWFNITRAQTMAVLKAIFATCLELTFAWLHEIQPARWCFTSAAPHIWHRLSIILQKWQMKKPT